MYVRLKEFLSWLFNTKARLSKISTFNSERNFADSLHTPVGPRRVGGRGAGVGDGGLVIAKSRSRVVHLPGHKAGKGVVLAGIG